MSKKTIARSRELLYQSLDEIQQDIESMLQNGYTKSGNWSLGQATSHVAQWATYPIDGFPPPPLPLRMIFWFLRVSGVSAKMSETILRDGFKPGSPTDPRTVPTPAISDETGVVQLKEAIRRIRDHEGTLHVSPLFGEMDKDRLVQLTRLHASHHLSFLKPNA